MSDTFQEKMCNIVLIKQLENSLQLILNVLPYVQFWSTDGAMQIGGFYHLAFRTKPKFVAPDITLLATYPVTTFCTFGSVIVKEAKITLFILRWPLFLYQRASLFCSCTGKITFTIDYVVFGKRHFLLSVSSRFWSEARWQTKTTKSYTAKCFVKHFY